MRVGEARKRIRDTLTGLVKEGGDLVGSTLEVTRGTTASILRGIRGKKTEAPRVAGEAVEGAIRAASEAGTELNSVAKSAVIGVIEGVGEVTKVTAGVLHDAVRAAVKGASDAGGDVATVARKAVEGAIEAGKQAGLKGEDAAAAAAAGAVEAAGEMGEAVAAAVTKAVSGTIAGVRVVFGVPPKRPVILAVDSNRGNLELLAQAVEQEGYTMRTASSLAELDQAIQGKEKIALALIDLSGFDRSVWEHCEQLQNAKIPYIIISPQRSPTVQKDSMRHGARGVLIKPAGAKELVEYIRTLLGE